MKGIILTLVAILGFAGVAIAQPSMEEIVKKWDARRAGIKSIKYEYSFVTTTTQLQPQLVNSPKGRKLPPAQLTLTAKHSLLLDLENGRYRQEYDGQEWDTKTGSVVPFRGATTFDGKTLKSVRYPNQGKSDVGVAPALTSDFAEIRGDFSSQAFQFELWPLFFDCGIVPLRLTDSLYPKQYQSYQPNEFADAVVLKKASGLPQLFEYELAPLRLGQGSNGTAGVTVHQGTGVVHNYTKTFPALSFVLRVDYSATNSPWPTIKKWTATTESKNRTRQSTVADVLKISTNSKLDDSIFDLQPASGMILTDVTQSDSGSTKFIAPELTKFRVQEDGSRLPIPDPDRPRSATALWKSLTLLLLFGIASCLALSKLLRRRSTTAA